MSAASSSNAAEPVWVERDGAFERRWARYSDLFATQIDRGSSTIPVFASEQLAANTREDIPKARVFRANRNAVDVADLCELSYLEEPNMLAALSERYAKDNIYTSVANVLIALNPCKDVSKQLYQRAHMERYRGQRRLDALPPHLYAVGERAYTQIMSQASDVLPRASLICCGESGSGKTESTKVFLRYLSAAASLNADTADTRVYRRSVVADEAPGPSAPLPDGSAIEQQVLQSNAVFESLGNAATLMNHNSSRFAKFMKLNFDASGHIVGAKTDTYLLEKSRVVATGKGERNFHIFYQLATSALGREKLGLQAPDAYAYLRRGGRLEVKGEATFAETCEALSTMNIDAEEQLGLWRVVAAVANLGNVTFEAKGADACALTKDGTAWAAKAADLLQLDPALLRERLVSRRIRIREEEFVKPLTANEAVAGRDAIAKALYAELFDHVVARVNDTLVGAGASSSSSSSPSSASEEKDDEKKKEERWIGVLDIFGFEDFGERNSFEQLCINFANESLQNYFNDEILMSEQDEYHSQGIFWEPVRIPDNTDVISLIAGRPSGLLCLLDSSCLQPKGSAATFHENAVSIHEKSSVRLRIAHQLGKSKNKRPKGGGRYLGFHIKHYAGEVQYDVSQFLFKNTDATNAATILLFAESKSNTLQRMFGEAAANIKDDEDGATRFYSVGTTFARQLTSLMATLRQTQPYFIRCASPNSEMKPNDFRQAYVRPQLRCGGLVEALRVLKYGYPSRVPYETILERYAHHLDPRPVHLNARNFCEAILAAFGLGRSQYQMGLTKVFFRPGKQEFLASVFRRSADALTPEIEAAIRKWLVRRRCQRAWQAVRVFVRWRGRMFAFRAQHAFRRVARLATVYAQTLQHTLHRVRRLKGARMHAVPTIQRWWRHQSRRKKLVAALEKRVAARRKNRFKLGAGLDAKSAEELNMLRIQMKAAKRKQERERAKLEEYQKAAEEKQLAAQRALEERKQELERMREEQARMRKREQEQAEELKRVAQLKRETEKLKKEQERAAVTAKQLIAQREVEYKQREEAMQRLAKEQEQRARAKEAEAARLAASIEQEREEKAHALKKLEADTERLRAEAEARAQEQARLLAEREAQVKKVEEESKQGLEKLTEEVRLQREAERRQREEEAARQRAEIADMRAAAEAQRREAEALISAREAEAQRKAEALARLAEEKESMARAHREQQERLRAEKEREQKEKEEALAFFKQESERAREMYEEQQRQQAELLREREEENRRKEAILNDLAAEAARLREEQERKQREAAEQLAKQEQQAHDEREALQREAKEREEAFEKARLAQEEQARSEMQQLSSQHQDAVRKLELVVLAREDEIEQLGEQASAMADDYEARLAKARERLQAERATVSARDAEIAALQAETQRLRDAHAELEAISRRLLDEAQDENAGLQRELDAERAAHAKLRDEHERLARDHADLRAHFSEQLGAEQDSLMRLPSMDRAQTTYRGGGATKRFIRHAKKGSVIMRERQATDARPNFTSILQQNILQNKAKQDFVALFPKRSGWMGKKRPQNKLLGTAVKQRWLVLEADRVSWWDKPTAAEPLGSLNLSDYFNIEVPEDGDAPIEEVKMLPRQKGVGKPLLLVPADGKEAGPPVVLREWVNDINKRISVVHYFDSQQDKSCRELVEFVCDDSAEDLRIENKVVDLFSGLLALRVPLATAPNLRRIALNNIALSDPAMEVLSDVVARSSTLEEIEVMHNLLGAEGAAHLSRALVKTQSVLFVKMSQNSVGDDGAVALAAAIKDGKLQRLALMGNKVGDRGAVALAAALEAAGEDRRFPKIELAENNVGDEGAAALARVVARNPHIQCVDLACNKVGDKGAVAFAGALEEKLCRLEELDLSSNRVSNEGVEALARAMAATHRGGVAVDLSDNKLVTRTGVRAVVDAPFAVEFQALRVVKN